MPANDPSSIDIQNSGVTENNSDLAAPRRGAATPVVKDLGSVLLSNAGVQVVTTVRGFAIPLLLTPSQYGLWRILLVAWQYGSYLHLGTFALLNRELPGLRARGELKQANQTRRTAFWGTMTITASVVILTIIAITWDLLGTGSELHWAVAFIAVGLIPQQLSVYILVQLRVESKFRKMSLQGFADSFLSLAFMVPLALVAGVPGLALGWVLGTAVAAALFARRSMFDRPGFLVPQYTQQVAAGAPLSSLPFLNASIASVGQLVVASTLGIQASGFFGLGLMLGMIVYAVPNAVGLVLYPRFLTSYATGSDLRYAGSLVRRSIRISTVISTSLVCLGVVLIEPLYRLVFPRYGGAITTTYLLLAMMPFVAYALVLQNALIALRKQVEVMAVQVACVVLSGVLSLVSARTFGTVESVACAVVLANLVSGLGTLWLGLSVIPREGKPLLNELLLEVLPIVGFGVLAASVVQLQQRLPRTIGFWGIAANFLLIATIAGFWTKSTVERLRTPGVKR